MFKSENAFNLQSSPRQQLYASTSQCGNHPQVSYTAKDVVSFVYISKTFASSGKPPDEQKNAIKEMEEMDVYAM